MAHKTAISNSYDMETAPKERTPIDIHVNGARGRCPNHGIVQVKVITSFMLGYRKNLQTGDEEPKSLQVCARCNSVIQTQAAKKTPQHPSGYRCFSCQAEYPAETKFLRVVGVSSETHNLVAGKMCPRCKEPTIVKVEKQS